MILDRNVLALEISRFAQPDPECSNSTREGMRCPTVNKSDHRHYRLLRPRRERPSSRCASEQRDELAPCHSITSSARASSEGGTVKPSALAVLRLITSSNLVGSCTGKSAGFSPLRMRSTYEAERRTISTVFGP